jgi:choline monooxygenase
MTLRPTMQANWKIAIENFVESYHLPWTHPELERVNPMRDHYQILGGRHFVGQGSTSHTGSSGPDPLPLVAGGVDRTCGEAIYLPPNLMLTRFPDFMMVNIVFPLAPDLTAERIELFVHPDAATGSRHQRGREALMDFLRRVNDEDIAICDKVQQGRRSPAFRGGFFARQHEATSQQFQQIVAMQMLGHDAAAVRLPIRDIPHPARLSA